MGTASPLIITVTSESQLSEAVERLLEYADDRKIFLLKGDLGAGKTALVKAVCQYFHADQEASSPTFSLINEYTYSLDGEAGYIYHLDLYRLESLEEALDIGIEDLLGQGQLCFIEWPGIIEPLVDSEAVQVSIEVSPEGIRKLIIL